MATPRVAALVTSDGQTQRSLATFVGAFLYAIVAVTAINARYYGEGGRAILFLVSLAVVAYSFSALRAAPVALDWLSRILRLILKGELLISFLS